MKDFYEEIAINITAKAYFILNNLLIRKTFLIGCVDIFADEDKNINQIVVN